VPPRIPPTLPIPTLNFVHVKVDTSISDILLNLDVAASRADRVPWSHKYLRAGKQNDEGFSVLS
jgi:hypothetical protein